MDSTGTDMVPADAGKAEKRTPRSPQSRAVPRRRQAPVRATGWRR